MTHPLLLAALIFLGLDLIYKGKVTGSDIKFRVTIGHFGDGDLLVRRQS